MAITQRQLLLISVGLIVACFASVLLFTLPALTSKLNLSTDNADHIGSAIGGITAPIIGIVSSLLLYLALSRQTESNIEQRLRNESDIVFLLLNQLDHEIDGFYTSQTKTSSAGVEKETLTGLAGLNVFTTRLRTEYDLTGFEGTFSDLFESGHILMISQSFNLVQSRIGISNLNVATKGLFQSKLETLYNCKLRHNIDNIITTININSNLEDWITKELRAFAINQSTFFATPSIRQIKSE